MTKPNNGSSEANTQHPSWVALAVGVLGGLAMVGAGWGYTVDDALISAKVSANISQGLGYRFNSSGEITDAVTPLGYAHLLSLWGGSVLEIFQAARVLGAISWVFISWRLCSWLFALGGKRGLIWFGVLALNPCAAAWAGSGMETAMVSGLVLFGLGRVLPVEGAPPAPAPSTEAGNNSLGKLHYDALAWLSLGLAAAWRPELVPCVGILLLGHAARLVGGRRVLPVLIGALPVLLVIGWRLAWFGKPVPLSAIAKPGEFESGLRYAIGGFIGSAVPLLVLAPWAWRCLSLRGRFWLGAIFVHGVSVCLAGGDWMALYRLYVPVLPLAVLVAAELFQKQPWWGRKAWGNWLRLAGTSLVSGLLWWGVGLPARGVVSDRLALIEAARPLLEGRRVAALDIGWVAAAGALEVVDLAGVTDYRIAILPGGHTSKPVDPNLLERRQAELVVLLWSNASLQPLNVQRFDALTELVSAQGMPRREVERRIFKEMNRLGWEREELVAFSRGDQVYRIFWLKNAAVTN